MTNYGYSAFFQTQMEHYPGLIPARVLAVHRESCRLITERGEREGKLKYSAFRGAEDLPAVGDWVAAEEADECLALIHAVLRRSSFFSRRNPSVKGGPEIEQAVAANFDIVCVCTSLNRDFSIPRLERFLTLGWQSGATPVVLLTKSDLAEDSEAMLREAQRAFPGVEAAAVSALTGSGLEVFDTLLIPGKTLVLLGTSGTGKSSLVNALLGEERMKTGDIREDDSRGRHTTTHRELIALPGGGLLIDTPGMRSVGMLDNADGLSETFADIEALRCRFSDCAHGGEPGCAVREAMEAGRLDTSRFERYMRLRRELLHIERREDFKQKQLAKKYEKTLSRQIKQHYEQADKYSGG